MTRAVRPRTLGPTELLAELATLRPHLVDRARRELPRAHASVLARLWGALVREPIAGIAGRRIDHGEVTVHLCDGRTLTGPADAAAAYARVEALTVLIDQVPYVDPSALVRALHLPGRSAQFADELSNSVANLALARAALPPPRGGPPALRTLAGRADALAVVEQSVVDGHPLHPCCRTRTGLSAGEILRYAPEHRPVIWPTVFAVPADRWFGSGPPLLVAHPWQREHVLDRYPWLTPVRRFPARPLMSLRTLAVLGTPHHVKTAVDVLMTSAVRTVSAAAIRNGPVVSDLVRRLTVDLPGFAVMPEVSGGAVLVDGEPCRSLGFLRRRAPRPGEGEVPVPLSALAAPSFASGRPLVTEAVEIGYGGDPMAYFADLARLVLPPLLTLLHRGVALEAHGQNTLVLLRHGRPVRLLYRDFGGIRVSRRRLSAHGIDPPPLSGDIPCDDPDTLRTKLFAAMCAGALAEQVALLRHTYGVDPDQLWSQVSAVARATYAALPRDASGDADALFACALPVKATTAMRLSADPLADIWATIPNPLSGQQ